jgi:ATP/maltotriose-dependent transcriptional regulator MalT
MSGRPTTEPVAAAVPLLRGTRLHAPRLRSDTLRRRHLTDELCRARPDLVVIVAPPGFGKTSLLADWGTCDRRRFAWLSIDPSDDDPTVLWAYVGAALSGVDGTKRQSDELIALAREPDPVEAVLRTVADTDDEIVLVLDDYHQLTNPLCHASIARLIELAPPNVQVAIASRVEPPFPVARLRASGKLIEMSAADLRFTSEECDSLLNGALALGLDSRAVAILEDRTEGWPAGLYLAYLSMRAAKDRDVFIDRFGATNRHVGDYLTEQVLESLEPDERRFMLATSVVDEMSGPLADALTDETGSADRLRELERANVFLTPLDDRREWYRYHHLLSELLRLELRRTDPDGERELHRRASAWFESAGDADRSIRHAIAGEDYGRAARHISASYLQALELGRIGTVAEWLELMGDERVAADARLSIVKAWIMHFMGLHDEATAALAAAQASSYEGVLPDGASSVDASAALMGAAFPGGDVGRMVANARRAFELESHPASPWRTTVHVLLGFALVRDGAFAEADGYLELGAELAMRHSMWMDAVGAQTLRGRVAIEAGRSETAERFAREAVDLADARGVAPTASGAFAKAVLGSILVHNGDPAQGAAYLDDAMSGVRLLREPLPLAETLLSVTQARRALGQRHEAISSFEEADALIDAMPDPGYLATTRRAVARDLLGHPSSAGEALSARELDVLRLLAEGLSKRDVAGRLFVSYNTVHSHVRSIYRKLGVASRADAVDRAREQGLVS